MASHSRPSVDSSNQDNNLREIVGKALLQASKVNQPSKVALVYICCVMRMAYQSECNENFSILVQRINIL